MPDKLTEKSPQPSGNDVGYSDIGLMGAFNDIYRLIYERSQADSLPSFFRLISPSFTEENHEKLGSTLPKIPIVFRNHLAHEEWNSFRICIKR